MTAIRYDSPKSGSESSTLTYLQFSHESINTLTGSRSAVPYLKIFPRKHVTHLDKSKYCRLGEMPVAIQVG
jgi:hypothetical protein